jgi:hypothetical protein
MVDLETLGTAADSVILSIGAVRFDALSDHIDDVAFYASISIESNLRHRRTLSEQTLCWWLQQSPEAQAVFFEDKMELPDALDEFLAWCTRSQDDECFWSNGADFDLPMLKNALENAGLPAPWKFWNTRCVRTLRALPQAADAPKPPNPLAHNALEDALAQARHVQAIYQRLSM